MSIQEEINKGVEEALLLTIKIDGIEKLQKRIVKAKEEGKDPTSLRNELADLRAKSFI